MLFTTLTFIIFLAIVFSVYWSLEKRVLQNLFLIVVGYIFYGWWDYRFCGLLLASSLMDYCVGLYLGRTENPLWRRTILLIGISFNAGLLGFFKYWNFFSDSLKGLLTVLGWNLDFITLKVILPVGISFYTFQSLAYIIDVYLRKTRPASSLIDYLAYISFFPQLVAGPIERSHNLLPQFENGRHFKYPLAAEGCRQMLWGFFKKMVVADNLSPIVDQAYSQPGTFSGPQLAFATFAFALQVYCDFSAYSDIAIGTAKLFGFDLMRNFAYPYFSQSMGEFWRRWHISLSTWLKDYIYIPLGGSRVSPVRRSWNVMITFLISGLWHGASWNFVIWGGIHGAAVLTEGLWSGKKTLRVTDTPGGDELFPRPQTALNILATFTLTCLAWIFFRAQTLPDALYILKKIFTDSLNLSAYQSLGTVWATCPIGKGILVVLAIFILTEWVQRRYPHPLVLKGWALSVRWLVYALVVWAALYWGTWSTGQFVYFQF